ncbi:MAG: hypothetical protein ACI85U_004140, partial [Candidatus Promineifilaceae bacterium]
QMIADQLLVGAVAQDNGRPRDDISVLVIATVAVESDTPIRRIAGTLQI